MVTICTARLKSQKFHVQPTQSVRPHGTPLPPDGFSRNLIFEYFSKICPEILSVINQTLTTGAHCTCRPIYTADRISLSSSYNEEHLRQNCYENQNIHFTFSNFFPESRTVYNVEKKYGTAGKATVTI